ncbi:hypothetical protein NDU88_006527 [Pleurodeles waltl]|uniref:Uncharacterized protein n=1 Tax=Pleurodeles waltl TaxID=8319 RepID=A0AAV7SPX0_PLEWA|nr:hypothetical protein NDU88_006527 [Pleurodeles waltl]
MVRTAVPARKKPRRRLSSDTAPESEWRYSRGCEIGVTRCPDDRGPGVSNVTPDFRVRESGKREDGRKRVSEESDAADFQTAEPTVTESENQEEPK